MLGGAYGKVLNAGNRGQRAGVWAGLFVCAWVLATLAVTAKPVPVPFSGDYLSSVWGLDEGLPENSCSGIVPAPDGSLWLGTFRGMARFNGHRMERFVPAGMPALGTAGVVNLHREPDGRIWVSTLQGLASFEGGHWRWWGATNGWESTGDYVRGYATRPGMSPVLSRFGGQVLRLRGDRFEALPMPGEGAGGTWVAMDDGGGVYAVRGRFAGYLRDRVWEPLPLPAGVDRRFSGAMQSRDGTAVVFSGRFLLRYRAGQLVGRLELSAPAQPFWIGLEDSTGRLWLPLVSAGVQRVDPDGKVRLLRKADGLAHDGPARAVHEDDQGGIWVGSGVGGVARLSAPGFRYLGEHEGLADAVCQSIAVRPDGDVLLGLYGVGIRRFDGIRLGPPPVGLDDETVGPRVRCLLAARDGSVWVGVTEQGVRRWEGGVLRPMGGGVFATNGVPSSLFEDSRGRIWVGDTQVVGCFEGGRPREVPLPGWMERSGVVAFGEGPDGVVVAGWRNGVFRENPKGGWVEMARLGDAVRITSLAVDGKGRVWVGSNGQGLLAVHGGETRRFGMASGLPSDLVGSLALDRAGRLWFGAGREAVRAEPDDVWAAGARGTEEVAWRVMGVSDGLRGLDFPTGSQPTVVADGNGRLWFGLVRGAAAVDPQEVRAVEGAARVLIESIRYVPDGGRTPVELPVEGAVVPRLPPGIHQLGVRFTALDFTAPERHRFRVRLGGRDAAWQDLGSEREVTFFRMPPGRHRLEVVAKGSDGRWNAEPVVLAFEVQRFLWQTAWFRGAAGLALLGLSAAGGWSFASRRLRQLRTQDALRRLSRALTAELDLPGLGRATAETCRALFGHDMFFLVTVEPDGAVRTCAWVEDTPAGESEPKPMEARLRKLSSRLDAVLAEEPILINRTGTADDPTLLDLSPHGFVERRSASMIFAPVRWNGRTVGVVSVQSYRAHRYGEKDVEQLQMLAAHCGAAIARIEADERRRMNEERLRLAMGTALMGSWVIDLRNGRLEGSPEAEVVYGYEPGGMPSTPEGLWQRAPGADAELVRRALEPLMCAEKRELAVTHRWGTGDGERWLEVTGRVHGAGDAGGHRLIGLTTDVTVRHQMEVARQRLEEQLRQSQKQEAIGTLAGGIAHDFNNLLAAILGNADAARMDLPRDHAAWECLDEIRKSGLRARDLVRRILVFSRPQEQVRAVIHLEALVDEVMKMLRPTIPSGVGIEVRVAPGVGAVLADGSQMHQVLVNLMTNAWHAVEDRSGQVRIELESVEVDASESARIGGLSPGRHTRLSVVDNGCGMSAEVQERIFDPFFTTKPPGKGTGLGLPVAQAIVRAHDGALTVESAPGKGAAFRVYLREATAGEVSAGGAPIGDPIGKTSAEGGKAGGGLRVLFVDDEPSLVRLGRKVLERHGCVVGAFTDTAEALDAFRSRPADWDAVVTDLAMPGISGLDLAREIQQVRPGLPILLCSGNLGMIDAAQAERVGIRCILPKPYEVEDLASAVARLARGDGGFAIAGKGAIEGQ